jgi:hypothetical protein
MGCHYPSCMMGSGDCHYMPECEAADKERWERAEEKRLLDIEEQKARIAYYKANTEPTPEGSTE